MLDCCGFVESSLLDCLCRNQSSKLDSTKSQAQSSKLDSTKSQAQSSRLDATGRRRVART